MRGLALGTPLRPLQADHRGLFPFLVRAGDRLLPVPEAFAARRLVLHLTAYSVRLYLAPASGMCIWTVPSYPMVAFRFRRLFRSLKRPAWAGAAR
jgi:hypothetical protein